MTSMKLDIGAEVGKGWQLFKANMGVLVVSGLLMMAVSLFSCGILAGAMQAGLFLLLARLIHQDPVVPQAGDLFKGFDFFLQTLLLMLFCFVLACILALIPVIGQLAGLVIGAISMWGVLFIVHQKLSAIEALKKIFTELGRGTFTMPLVFGLLVSVISGLGVLACFVGLLFTVPLGYAMMAVAYETCYGDQADESEVIEPEVVPPPPPDDLRL